MKIALLIALAVAAPAIDRGQFGDVSPKVRAWFSQPRIKACCDLSDGIPTEFEMRPDGYYVPVPWSKEPVRVPSERVISNLGNPVGHAIIWFNEDAQYIRCFVPGGGV